MGERPRIVVDTNALVSRLLVPRSVPGQAVRRAIDEGRLLASEDSMAELASALAHPKLDPYASIEERRQCRRLLGRFVETVPILPRLRACRLPRGDKLFELAGNGAADLIISGDLDLVRRSSFRAIPIPTRAHIPRADRRAAPSYSPASRSAAAVAKGVSARPRRSMAPRIRSWGRPPRPRR